jgi:hypothetical protein
MTVIRGEPMGVRKIENERQLLRTLSVLQKMRVGKRVSVKVRLLKNFEGRLQIENEINKKN